MPEKISFLESVILGVLQGTTEFLPVSSSGHLALANHLLGGLPDPRAATAYFVVLHVGTLLAVACVFRKEILSLAGPNRRATLSLAVGTVPAVLLYLLAGDRLEEATHNLPLVGGGFLCTAVFLLLSERGWRRKKGFSEISILDGAIVGTAQALAILPGASRSGLTISTARMRGATRPGAATYSFLLSVPAILGALIVEAPALADLSKVADPMVIAVGFTVAFVTGLTSLLLLLRVIRSGKLAWFAPYCGFLGLAALYLGW